MIKFPEEVKSGLRTGEIHNVSEISRSGVKSAKRMTEERHIMGKNTVRTLRVLELLKDTDEEHPITASEIVEKLDRLYAIGAERKAVGRDIEDLNYCGYSIVLHDDNKRGWYMEHPFEDWELKILTDAVQSAKFLDQKSTDVISEKLRSLSGADGRRTLAVMAVPADSKRGDNATKYAVANVLQAMRRRKKVQFTYVHTDDKKRTVPKHPGGTKPVSPYALIWRKDKYYLIGTYDDECLSYYRLDRIRNLSVSDEAAVPLQDILGSNAEQKLRSFVKKNIYNKKGEEVRLRLSLMSNGVDTVLDSFGEDAHVIPNGDGTVEAYVTASDSEGLCTWLMHHGQECAVIEPESVREEMRRRLEAMLENYS